AATSVPGVVGYSAVDPCTPVLIGPLLDCDDAFGNVKSSAVFQANTFGLQISISTEEDSGAVTRSVDTVRVRYGFQLRESIQLYFTNGGGPCWVSSAGAFKDGYTNTSIDELEAGLNALELIDEVTLLLIPDAIILNTEVLFGSLMQQALQQCDATGNRFVIMDTWKGASLTDATTDFRDQIGTSHLMHGAAYFPHVGRVKRLTDAEVMIAINTDTSTPLQGPSFTKLGNYNSLADLKTSTDAEIVAMLADTALMEEIEGHMQTTGVYNTDIGSCGAVAGVYCAVDRNRGVWKAPANVSLTGYTKLSMKIGEADHGTLNVDATGGKSINAIRSFTGKGDLVFGARTLDGNSNEWRYVPVRRLFTTVEESVKRASFFSVFEPNDANTWTKVKAMIENYLAGLWRQGALAGSTPEQAFFVNVGLGTTMVPQDILEGNLIVEIGMAAVRPAEFIILRFSHKLQEA
ncbi:MAG: phage tail sheath family protein, partial [Salibacteraceae bacterium]